jgi:hypothetical protein
MLSDILNHFARPQECLELEKYDYTSICKMYFKHLYALASNVLPSLLYVGKTITSNFDIAAPVIKRQLSDSNFNQEQITSPYDT